MAAYSSDEDLEMGMFEELEFQERQPCQFNERKFDENIDDKTFCERYRVPPQIVDLLEEKLNDRLMPKTGRNKSLSARDQIKVFLHFLGTNAFYHVVRDCHKIRTDTVFRWNVFLSYMLKFM